MLFCTLTPTPTSFKWMWVGQESYWSSWRQLSSRCTFILHVHINLYSYAQILKHLLLLSLNYIQCANIVTWCSTQKKNKKERIGEKVKKEGERCVISFTAWMHYASIITHSLLHRTLYPHCLHYTVPPAPSLCEYWIEEAFCWKTSFWLYFWGKLTCSTQTIVSKYLVVGTQSIAVTQHYEYSLMGRHSDMSNVHSGGLCHLEKVMTPNEMCPDILMDRLTDGALCTAHNLCILACGSLCCYCLLRHTNRLSQNLNLIGLFRIWFRSGPRLSVFTCGTSAGRASAKPSGPQRMLVNWTRLLYLLSEYYAKQELVHFWVRKYFNVLVSVSVYKCKPVSNFHSFGFFLSY